MKKWLVLLIIMGLLGVVYYMVVTFVEYTPGWLAGEKVKITRGSIRSPVTASGTVEPAKMIEIKSEASGEVTHILVEEGDFVRKGATLIVLDPNDEQRSYEIALLQLAEAETNYKIATEQAKRAAGAGMKQAEASKLAAKAEYEDAKARLDKLKAVTDTARTPVEYSLAQTSVEAAQARMEAADAALMSASSEARLAEYHVEVSKKSVDTAKKNASDAEERLSETTIKAPSDGMIAKVMVQVGTLVQSGTKSLTGGTMLLKLADTSKLYVLAMVDDADFGLVRRIAPDTARPQMRPEGGAGRVVTNTTTNPAASQVASDPEPQTPTSLPVDPTKRVKVIVDTFPDEEFWGVIERIDPEGQAHGAIVQYSVHVRLISPNSFELLQLGLPAQVEFTAESRENVLMVESRCIRKEGEEYGVFVPDPTPQDHLNTRFVRVRTGLTDGTHTEILAGSGLKEGDEVYLVPPRPPRERGKK
jgi:multidrug efflux pump subunit AcrA (membrane-fusion protein)